MGREETVYTRGQYEGNMQRKKLRNVGDDVEGLARVIESRNF